MNKEIVKCPICGEPYVFHKDKKGYQEVCPQCKAKAWSKEPKPDPRDFGVIIP